MLPCLLGHQSQSRAIIYQMNTNRCRLERELHVEEITVDGNPTSGPLRATGGNFLFYQLGSAPEPRCSRRSQRGILHAFSGGRFYLVIAKSLKRLVRT